MFRSRAITPRRPCWFRSQATTESSRPALISSGGTAPKNTNLQNKRPYRCNPDAGIPLGPSPAENRNALSAPFSPWWVTYQKTQICETNSLKGVPRTQEFHWDCRRQRFEIPRRLLPVRVGPLIKNTNLRNKQLYEPAAGCRGRILATFGGKPSGHGSARPYIGRMTRSHRSLPAELQSLGFCDRSLSNLETW